MEKIENGKKNPINETGTRSPRRGARMEVTSNTLIVIIAIATLLVVLVCLELRIRHSRACWSWMDAGAVAFGCLTVSNYFPVAESIVEDLNSASQQR